MSRRILAMLALPPLLLLGGCTMGDPQAVVTVTANPSPSATSNLAPTAQFELQYVRRTAPRCDEVWFPGQVLPANYEWCQSTTEGRIAGIRIGSCEVVVFEDRMYAVPGREVVQAQGDVTNDPGFREATTACKRRPFAPVN